MQTPHLLVVGNVFVDVKGYAQTEYDPHGKNVGDIRFAHGGVGRNVASNLAAFELRTTFVATVDRSALGQEVVERLAAGGVDTSAMRAVEQGMGMWLAILDETGQLAGSISRQPDFGGLSALLEREGDALFAAATHAVLSVDLTADIARRVIALARKHRKPLLGLPNNLSVAAAHPELLAELDVFVCNDVEAGRLSGEPWTAAGATVDERLDALRRFVRERSLRAAVVTLGAEGAVYGDAATGRYGHQPAFPAAVVDTSGAGDAFSAGVALGLARGWPLERAVAGGAKIAAWVVEAHGNDCTDARLRMESDPLFAAP
ncbi:PfkB family carbohydrate kinase [Paenibacillus sp. TRM 82003]|nr:PfkB family carbohydrate kinase [Paenibacillus sp. TRM 82003]